MNIAAMSQGFPLALTGMTVVFLALGLMSLFIAALPRMLRVLERAFPESLPPEEDAVVTVAAATDRGTQAAVAAAVAVIIHQHHPPQGGK